MATEDDRQEKLDKIQQLKENNQWDKITEIVYNDFELEDINTVQISHRDNTIVIMQRYIDSIESYDQLITDLIKAKEKLGW